MFSRTSATSFGVSTFVNSVAELKTIKALCRTPIEFLYFNTGMINENMIRNKIGCECQKDGIIGLIGIVVFKFLDFEYIGRAFVQNFLFTKFIYFPAVNYAFLGIKGLMRADRFNIAFKRGLVSTKQCCLCFITSFY